MPFNKVLNKDFFIKDGKIVLSEQYMKDNAWKFKKVTGTRLAAICSANNFNSPVKTWCQMVGIYYEPMSPIIANAGVVIEPKIREFVEKQLNIKFKSYDPKDVKWDIWHEEDWKKERERIFGGIPDGEALDENGNLMYDEKHPILEIKTMGIDKFLYKKEKGLQVLQLDENGHPIVKELNTGKAKHFINGKFEMPKEYLYQLALYLYLRKATHGIFAVCFIKPEDYINPEACDVNKREIKGIKFILNDSNKKMIESAMAYATDWYNKYIKGGYSPSLSKDDEKWLSEVEYEANK